MLNNVDSPYLSVVIPAYDEEPRIGVTLEKLLAYFSGQSYTWEIIVADDGSRDRTPAIVKEWAAKDSRIKHLALPHAGKGWAVKNGMLTACGHLRFMCDADLAMPIYQLGGFIEKMRAGYDIVIGSRQAPGARRFDEPAGRHVMGRVFNWTIRALAVGSFQDTQCGFKCFRGEVAEDLFRQQQFKGFSFDVEILHIAVRKRLRILDMPIDWYHQKASKVRPFIDSFAMLKDTLSLRVRDIRKKRKY
ncbi:MAG: glycosyltransferase family 2 protein [SAR202 cluster bacterium]|nr:glycosyltransferase family 2 protein [SAR202 cluster bacterium]